MTDGTGAEFPRGGTTRRAVIAGGGSVLAASVLAARTPAGVAGAVSLLSISGPIPATSASKPWGSVQDGGPRERLAARYDFVEEEFFLSGLANVYGPATTDLRQPGQSPQAYAKQLRPLSTLRRPAVPYTTRLVVLRPRAMRRFSGTVHLVPLHNLDATTYVEKNLLRRDDAWIGVEVNSGARFGVEERESGGIANLRRVDPQRYGVLTLPAGSPEDWPSLKAPGVLGRSFKAMNFGRPDDNHQVWREEISRSYAQAPDILTQLAEAVRGDLPGNPLAGYRSRRIYMAGRSGQSTIMAPYIDHHHGLALDTHGHVPFEGYMIRVGAWPVSRPRGSVLVLVLSEAEVAHAPASIIDELTDSDDPMFRYYEVAGVGHGLTARPNISESIGQMVPKGVAGISDIIGATRFKPYDHVSLPLIWGMFETMREWIDKGRPMPRADRIMRDSRAPDGIGRDADGNAIGGLRLPWMDVPDAQYVGSISKQNPLEGGMSPFSETRMTELYGDRSGYQARLRGRLERMASQRWIAREDIPLMLLRGTTAALALGDDRPSPNDAGTGPTL